ncbi:P-loop containing nucleoside triphosphate hydrolase protein [Glonium stellatum]|uniref:P-loop containing nucleoside triphosphate hydrolase protein n=1 Tax=Glonium stellatum TaxID=574774 RepID=A0A8E2F5M7_9PEZI|nr:P-loop containing nucleoside triphosphate hydrolase protein [Glonium stellatum]
MAIDELMAMIGLEDVKNQVLAINNKAQVCELQGIDLAGERFNAIFQGNPGTGKTTVARIYAKFLEAIGLFGDSTTKETSGAELGYLGPLGVQTMIDELIQSDGGVLFVDEAYQLVASHTSNDGRRAHDIILTAMENNIGNLVVVFAGYNKEMEALFEHNSGLASRMPYVIQFPDFTEAELWKILVEKIAKKYNGKMQVEGGIDGLYIRVAIRRIAHCRGHRGFGNARAIENLLSKISERQAIRLMQHKRSARKELAEGSNSGNAESHSGHFFFNKEDIIGPDPSQALFKCAAWDELQDLTGLDTVKKAAETLISLIEANYRRELAEKPPFELTLNRAFVGSPGTGKTTVAKLYGRILADLGLLSSGEVVVKTPADFIGACLGKSEANTRAILNATVGKVLIIDEAYMLNSGDHENQNDSFRAAVVDTLVAEVQGAVGEDRCILLLGYKDKIMDMFRNMNPGLSRRFSSDDPFQFEDFDLSQLKKILHFKIKKQGLGTTPEALPVAYSVLDKCRMRPNYCNAAEVASLLSQAKFNYQTRQRMKPAAERMYDGILEPADFDPDFSCPKESCRSILEGHVRNDVIDAVERCIKRTVNPRPHQTNRREQIRTRLIFKGPPGTGKATVARSMGKLYYNIGFLSTPEVIECSASDLIGRYMGHTSPKTKAQLEKGLGKVLFIKDAYRLVSGDYSAEAVNEMTQLLSLPRYEGKIVVILAGSGNDLKDLIKERPSFGHLFRDEIVFKPMTAEECVVLLNRELLQKDVRADFLDNLFSLTRTRVTRIFEELLIFPSWSNGRDVKALAADMAESAYEASAPDQTSGFVLSEEQVFACLQEMLRLNNDRYQQKSQMTKTDRIGAEKAKSKEVDISSTARTTCVDNHVDVGMHDRSSTQNPTISTEGQDLTGRKRKQSPASEEREQIQKKLRSMGRCVMGYIWNKADGGWRCEGGTHFVADSELRD